MLRDTLAIQQRVLGEGHLITLATATDLAILIRKTGHAEAEELGRGALAQAQRTLAFTSPRYSPLYSARKARRRRQWPC